MDHVTWIDPVVFASQAALTVQLTGVNVNERRYLQDRLTDFLSSLYDCPLFYSKPKRFVYKFVRGFIDRTVSFINSKPSFHQAINDLKNLGNEFLRSLTSDTADSLVESPIYLAIRQVFVQKDNARLVKWIYQYHVLLSKMPVDRPDLLKPAETAWAERQAIDYSGISFDGDLVDLRTLVSWLTDVELLNAGKHGPGVVNNRLVKDGKTSRAKAIADKNSVYAISPALAAHDYIHPVESVSLAKRECVHIDELTHVAKDSGSLRAITITTSGLQYYQQLIKIYIYHQTDVLRELPLSNFVRFSDQTLSQQVALLGSKNNDDEWMPATIDLKDSSDRLSLDLVSNLFTGDELHFLMVGRSDGSETSLGYIEHSMYGGMGSALTFPVQTIIYTAFALLATIRTWHTVHMGKTPYDLSEYLGIEGLRFIPKRLADRIRIYGDDIALPSAAATELFRLLRKFGLVVNENKSFIGSSPIRESCGIYAYRGVDITPQRLRIPIYHTRERIDSAVFDAYRQAINLSFFNDMPTLRRSLIKNLLRSSVFASSSGGRKASALATHKIDPKDLLWEPYRGRQNHYIGFISTKSSSPTGSKMIFGQRTSVYSVWHGATSSEDNFDSEFYWLTQSYSGMSIKDIQSEAHAKIPRGIRLIKRNAYRISARDSDRPQTYFGWEPKSVKSKLKTS